MSPLGTLAAALTLSAAAGIHAVAAGSHLRQWPTSGVFFITAAIAQAACAYWVLRGTTDRTARLIVGINLALVGLWTLSRTIGMPFGPHAGEREAIGALDAIATIAEVLSIAVLLGSRRVGRRSTALPAISRVMAAMVVATVVGLGTASAGALPSHDHGAQPQPHAHEH